jgi:hypothetical protein
VVGNGQTAQIPGNLAQFIGQGVPLTQPLLTVLGDSTVTIGGNLVYIDPTNMAFPAGVATIMAGTVSDANTALNVTGGVNPPNFTTVYGTNVPLFTVSGTGTFNLNGNPGLVNVSTNSAGFVASQFAVLSVSGSGTVNFSPSVVGLPSSLINVQDGTKLYVGYTIPNYNSGSCPPPACTFTPPAALAPVVSVTGGTLSVLGTQGTLLTVGVTGGGGNTVQINGSLLNASGGSTFIGNQVLTSADLTAKLMFNDYLIRLSGTAALTVQGNAGANPAITFESGTLTPAPPGLLTMTGSSQATLAGGLVAVTDQSGTTLTTSGSVIQLIGTVSSGPTLTMGAVSPNNVAIDLNSATGNTALAAASLFSATGKSQAMFSGGLADVVTSSSGATASLTTTGPVIQLTGGTGSTPTLVLGGMRVPSPTMWRST